jgi:peroxiredoxin
MAVTPSTMRALGSRAPHFQLPDTGGCQVSLDDFKDRRALLVVFMCNHCPYVKHILRDFLKLAREYQQKGLGVVGISANDVESYPEDGLEHMRRISDELEFPFPYLYDQSQQVAKTYGAACTPDFFLFDGERKLVYRGQFDASRPGNDIPISGKDLRAAVDEVLAGRPVSTEQRPSLGCNIKWKPGNEPEYYGASH